MIKKTGFVEEENITLLAKGVLIKGEIRVEGTVRIDGRLEGDIHTKGTVVIGEDGVVQGTNPRPLTTFRGLHPDRPGDEKSS